MLMEAPPPNLRPLALLCKESVPFYPFSFHDDVLHLLEVPETPIEVHEPDMTFPQNFSALKTLMGSCNSY